VKLPVVFLAGALLGLGIAGCAHTYRIPSSAMEPTIHCGKPGIGCEGDADDHIATQSVRSGTLKRGQIVIFEAPKPAAEEACGATGKFVKRVIGLPGERVSERNGFVYVDDRRLSEPYLKPARRDHQNGAWVVPEGHYFLMGDNRRLSCDSRRFGSVPFGSVLGRVTTIIRDGRSIPVP
jgi:signal peptidase I